MYERHEVQTNVSEGTMKTHRREQGESGCIMHDGYKLIMYT